MGPRFRMESTAWDHRTCCALLNVRGSPNSHRMSMAMNIAHFNQKSANQESWTHWSLYEDILGTICPGSKTPALSGARDWCSRHRPRLHLNMRALAFQSISQGPGSRVQWGRKWQKKMILRILICCRNHYCLFYHPLANQKYHCC